MEAQLCGTLVLASRVDRVTKFLIPSEEFGLTFSLSSIDELANAMDLAYLMPKHLLEGIAPHAQARATKLWHPVSNAKRYNGLLHHLVNLVEKSGGKNSAGFMNSKWLQAPPEV